jgi:hypothetical protein
MGVGYPVQAEGDRIMKCPACGYDEMKHRNWDRVVSCLGKAVTAHDVSGFRCPEIKREKWPGSIVSPSFSVLTHDVAGNTILL